jgi:hypothetical protein
MSAGEVHSVTGWQVCDTFVRIALHALFAQKPP